MTAFVAVGSNCRWTEPASSLPDPPAWREHGACRGVDPNIFFPERGESCVEAKAICAGCPVRGECLDYALDLGEKFGIWGGTSERERRRMRPTRRAGRADSWSAERRRQVQSMAAQGMPYAEIARDLGVSPRTIFRYVSEAAS